MEIVPNPFETAESPEVSTLLSIEPLSSYSLPLPLSDDSLSDQYRRLQAREAALLRRQQQLHDSPSASVRTPNWPPHFSFLYVSLDSDIPRSAHSCIKTALLGIILSLVQSLIDIIACSSISGLPSHNYVKSIIFSIIFGLLTCYLTIGICFDKLYTACKVHDVPFSYVIMQFGLIGWIAYLCVGFPNSGSVGVATLIDLIAKSGSVWSIVIAAVNSAILLGSFVVQVTVMRKAQKYQKISGVPENMQRMITTEL
jgi:uncharacterized membrane protein (UPF0136 family)